MNARCKLTKPAQSINNGDGGEGTKSQLHMRGKKREATGEDDYCSISTINIKQ